MRVYRPYLEELFRSAPWVLMVFLGVIAGWTAEQVQALLVLLIPIIAIRSVQPQVA